MAPCSHTWHYKCIRPVLDGPQFPHFTCPNCRAVADLDADVDEPTEGEWEELDQALEQSQAVAISSTTAVAAAVPAAEEELAQPSTVVAPAHPLSAHRENENPTLAVMNLVDFSTLTGPNASSRPHSNRPLPTTMADANARRLSTMHDGALPSSRAEITRLTAPIAISDPGRISGEARRGRESPEQRSAQDPVENPMTPRNDAGPFIFDGSATARENTVPWSLEANVDNPYLERMSDQSS